MRTARLAARIWLPEDAETKPVPGLLEYIPYRKSDYTSPRDALRQPYLAAHGYAVVRVDMRGSGDSDGVLLDEYLPQEKADGLEVLAWIAAQPELDAERVVVTGRSYGGYMVLASLAHFGDRLCAGIEAAGIANFNSFLEQTESYRQARRREEYGDERDPVQRAKLAEISPLTRVGEITKPMFVITGANDPRVPNSEADQMVAAIRANGGEAWHLVASDEGHGFAKKANSDYAFLAQLMFWQEHLLSE